MVKRILICLGLLLASLPAMAQQGLQGTIINPGTEPLNRLWQNNATNGQVIAYQTSLGTWSPATLSVGTGLSLNFSGGTFTFSLTTPVAVANGGTGANLSATGPGVLQQASSGANVTVGAVNLASSSFVTGNLPVTNLNSGTGASSTTFWRGDGTWATPSGGGGGGSPVVSAGIGAGGLYSLTQNYGDTGVTITLSSAGTYRLDMIAEVNDTTSAAGDDLRCLLFDPTNSAYPAWSEARQIASQGNVSGVGTFATRQQLTSTCIYTPTTTPAIIHIYAANPTSARGTVNPYGSQIIATAISGTSAATQDTNSFPTLATSACSHYDFSTLTGTNGSNISSISDTGTANLTLTSGATKPTLAVGAWNGRNMAHLTFANGVTLMTTSGVPTTSTSWELVAVVSVPTATTNNFIFGNGDVNGGINNGYGIAAGSTANSLEGFISGVGNVTSAAQVPNNGVYLLDWSSNAGAETLYINNVSVGTASLTQVTPTVNILVGTGRAGASGSCNLGEVELYPAVLSSTDRTTLANYEMSKWRL